MQLKKSQKELELKKIKMTDYITQIKRNLRDFHGFVPIGGTKEDPIFSDEPKDGIYPMEINGRIDNVEIKDGNIYCCRFNNKEEKMESKPEAFIPDGHKVPLRLDWLSENDLLEKAAPMLSLRILRYTKLGVVIASGTQGNEETLSWTNTELLFTLAQLKELGFE